MFVRPTSKKRAVSCPHTYLYKQNLLILQNRCQSNICLATPPVMITINKTTYHFFNHISRVLDKLSHNIYRFTVIYEYYDGLCHFITQMSQDHPTKALRKGLGPVSDWQTLAQNFFLPSSKRLRGETSKIIKRNT